MIFSNLSERLTDVAKKLRGQGRLTENNIKGTLRDVRISLLEADVALPVVKIFIEQIRQRAVGQEVTASINPGQALVKIINEELVEILGHEHQPLNLSTQPPAVILIIGLQGSGKTTTVAKLSQLLKDQENKKVMVTSTDIYRPAAIEQLARLAEKVGVDYCPSNPSQQPVAIAQQAVDLAKKQFSDVLLVDTAGRLHIDNEMIAEVQAIEQAINPIETLLVVDSMTGQDAANVAKAFNEAVPLTGIILTKTDGDARGGAALSMRQVTGKPIKFIGAGEKTDALEVFYPERIASRILGMGDILSLVEEAERKVDKKKTAKLAKKIRKGSGFDLADFRDQILQMNNMGGVMGMITKLPAMLGKTPSAMSQQFNNQAMNKMVVIINSMTPKERRFSKLINGSRKRRIARGSGLQIQDVNHLLKQFAQMQKMMKKLSKPGGMKKLMQGMQSMPGFPKDL